MFVHNNHAAGGDNGSIMVGMFVFLCLASQKPSEQEFFVPARTDLGVKRLRKMEAIRSRSNNKNSMTDSIDVSLVSPCPHPPVFLQNDCSHPISLSSESTRAYLWGDNESVALVDIELSPTGGRGGISSLRSSNSCSMFVKETNDW
jgi:hypothetical protein